MTSFLRYEAKNAQIWKSNFGECQIWRTFSCNNNLKVSDVFLMNFTQSGFFKTSWFEKRSFF